jgi:transposase-like protein
MTRPFSVAFKQKMIERLTGKESLSASQLSRETCVRQQNLSRWLQEARSLPLLSLRDVPERTFSLEQKARVLADAANLRDEELHAYLEREGSSSLTSNAGASRCKRRGDLPSQRAAAFASSSANLHASRTPLAQAAALLVLKKDRQTHPDVLSVTGSDAVGDPGVLLESSARVASCNTVDQAAR